MNEVDKAILKASKSAGSKLKKPVTINEFLQFMPKTKVKTLKKTYGSYFKDKLYKTVDKLKNKKLIIYCGKSGRESFYIHADYAEFKGKHLPVPQGERILKVFSDAVDYFKRPITFNELKKFADEVLSEEDLKNSARILSQLADMGKILKLSKLTGMVNSRNIYSLPNREFSEAYEIPVTTPSHAVKKSFDAIWKENCQKAQNKGELPRPVLTKQLRKYVWKHYPNVLRKKKILDSVLLSLKHYENPFIRKIERSFHYNAWAPHDSVDSELNLEDFYANNQERVTVAIKRACSIHNRPVTVLDIQEQITLDRALTLDIEMPFNAFLHSAAKNAKNPKKKVIRRVGEVSDETFYVFGNKKAVGNASNYVLFLNSRLRFKNYKFQKRLDNIGNCKLQTVVLGRASLIKEEAEEMKMSFTEILSGNKQFFPEGVSVKCGKLITKLENFIERTDSLISKTNVKKLQNPNKVNRYVQTISAEDLILILSPTYPAIARAKDSNVVVRILNNKYIKLDNPGYKNRFSNNAKEATRYLYDLTDVLIKTALKRGGQETNFQATLANNELGRLRDERLVLPALKSKNFEDRITAVACLAFLQDSNSVQVLQKIMFEDCDPNVRKTAVWAYAFAKKTNFSSTIKKFIKCETNEDLRVFASMIADCSFKDLWRV